jgi:gliding motility-associated-like protein
VTKLTVLKLHIYARILKGALYLVTMLIVFTSSGGEAFAQCDTTVPAFVADLRGNPDSTWISPNVSREDNCCGTSNPDRCIKFTVYLDSLSQGIRFDFHSGAVPSGSLFYQIGCGTSYAVGADICLNGQGPHVLTFCKPGNNQNEYKITAIPAPQISPGITVSMACVGQISVSGLVTDSITWESVPFNSTYNGFLNCTSGCDSVTVTPTGTFPDSIMYRACGPIQGGCAGTSFCDTVTVYFVTDLAVQIQPDNPTLCFGDTATTITAHATGGLKPFKFYWSHIGGSGQGDSVQYVDTGTYIVSLLDSLGCSFAYDTVIVTGYSSSILANAGVDTFVCRSDGVLQLNGSVDQATGGIWSGQGSFSLSDTLLNATYTLSASELTLGQAVLTLITTGNGTCPADTDQVIVTVEENPPGTLTGMDTVCQFETHAYLADNTPGQIINWSVSGGSIVGGNSYNEIYVQWEDTGVGTVTMYRQSPLTFCDTTVNFSVWVFETPVPDISGPDSACEFETVTYTLPFSASETYNWSVSGGSIVNGQSTNSVNVFWNSYGTGVITVTVANVNGCDSAVSDSIVIVQKPTPSISGFDSSCHNKIYTYMVTNFIGNTYNWSVSNGTLVTGQGTNSATILWGTAGTGIVTMTETSAFGCDSTVSDTVFISYTPVPVLTGDDSVCHNKITTYSVPAIGGDTYSWTVSNGAIVSGQGTNSIDILWGTVGTSIVGVTQTSAFGCDSTVTDTVVIVYTPAPVLTGDDTVCHNKITTYSVPAVGGDSYTWSVSNGTIISGQGTNSIDVLWGVVTGGSVRITQTSPFGCDSTVNMAVLVIYTPAPVITGTDTVCHNKIYTYSTPAVGGDSYVWVVNNGTITSGQGSNSVDILWGAVGVGTISVTETSGFSCDSTVQDSVVILYSPAPVVTGPDTACQNKIVTYSTLDVAGDSYSWTVSNGSIIAGQGTHTIDVMWNNIGTGRISVNQVSPLGCDSSAGDTIIILYTPAPVISGDDSTCHNKIYTYTAPAVGGDSYSWSVNNGTIITGQGTNSVDILWGTAGVGTVSVTETSGFSCDSTVLDSIVILYTPAPVISGTDSTCHNKIYTYTTPAVGGDSYSWSVNNGTIITGQGTNSVDILWGTAGVGTVSVTETSGFSCDSTVLDSIVILYTPAPVISGTDSTCHNKIYTYTTPAVGGDSYSWSVNNGTIITGQGTNSVDILWGTAGVGTVSITQTSPLSCDSTVLNSIVILYTPAPVISGEDSACHNKIYTYATPAVGGDTYSWSINNGTIISGQGTNSVDVLWGTAGIGVIRMAQTSPLGCDSSVRDTIVILYTPAPVISGPDSTCHNKIYTYTTPAVGGDSYSWSVNNGTIISGQGTNSIDILWGTAGVGTVSISQTSLLGCDSTVLDTIIILYTPAPVISGDDSTCHNKIYTYTTPAIGGDSYLWSVNNGAIVSGQGTNSIDILWGTAGVGTVSITQTSSLGCDSTVLDSIVILYTPAPVISGPDSTCHNKIYTYTTPAVGGDTYSWSVNNGTIITGQGTNSVDILWGTAGVGTVSITQTSPLGCDSTVLDSIVILYTPAPVISGPDSTCHNNIYAYTTPAIGGDTYSWSVSNGTIITGQGTNSIDILWGTAGVGTVTITQTSPLGCDSTVLDSIVILYTPAPVISGPDSTCHNNIYAYTTPAIGGDTYSWSVSNGTIITGQGTNSIDILWGTAGVGTVSIIQTSPLGCDSTVLDSIVILYTPAPVISGEDSTCHNNIYTYTTPAIGGDTYSWNVSNGAIISGQGTNSIDILWGTAGVGTVGITQTSPLGCDSTVQDSIVILYTPAPEVSGPDSTCHNKIYTYTTPTVGGDTYSWSVNNGTIITGQGTNSVDILWSTAGVGTVSITQTSPLGCDSTVLDSIVILYTPAPVISGEDSTCHNNIYTYTTPAIGGDTYSWSVSNGSIISGQGTNSVDILWGTAGIGTVSITQTSPLGCDSTVLDSIVILYTPTPVLTGPDTTCHNEIQAHSVPNMPGDSYNWVTTNGTIISGQGTNSVDVLWGVAGTGMISVTQTSPLGCDSTVTDSIIVILYTPAPVISGTDSVCDNNIYTYSTPIVAGDSYTWAVSGGTILSGQNTNNIDVVWNGAGSGSVSVYQVSPLGCDSTITLPVQVLYTPAPLISGPDSACQNKIYSFSVTNVGTDSYIWAVTNGTIIAGQGTHSIDVMMDSVGSGIITVTQTSPLGCDSTITDTIAVIYTPAPVLSGNDSTCHNKIYTYSVTDIAGDSYVWNVTNGIIVTGQNTNTVDVLWGTAGSGTVSVTQTSPLGCDSTLSATITILYTPAPVISGPDSTCQNKIYSYSIPNIAGDTYSWNITNGTIIAGQGTNSIDVMLDSVGSGIITVTQTSPLGCDSTITDTITVIYTPAPVLTGADTTCHNKIYTYSVTNIAGDSYTWNLTNGTIVSGQSTNTVDVLWGTAGSGTVSVTQTSPLGCDSTLSATITILYTPAPIISGPDSTCQNKIYSYSIPNVAGDAYAWSLTNGTIIAGQGTNSIDVMMDSVGSGVVSVTQTSPLGCDSTITDTIDVIYTPVPVLTGADSTCHNKIYTYSVPNTGGDSYVWNVTNGTIVSGQSTNTVHVLWGIAGSGSISITQTSSLGCDSTLSATITILYTPAPVISGPDSTCQNKIYSYSIPNVADDTYSWSLTNGTIIAGQGTNSIDVMMDSLGSGVVSVTQTSPLGCDSTITDTITVIYTPAPVLTGADTTCHNKIYTYSVTNVAGDSYVWNVTNGTIVTGQSTNTVDVLWGTAGSGTVSVTQTSPLGCDSTLSATITILYTPTPVISGPDSTCHNNIYTYSTSGISGDSYIWNVNNGTIVAGQGTNSVDILWGTAGTGTVSITQTSGLGCDSTVTDSIIILYTPAPVISGPDSTCQNKIYSYSISNVPGDTYAWSLTNGTIIAGQGTNSIDVMMDSVGSGIIAVTQTSPLGCDSTITDTIKVIYTPVPVLTGDDTVCHNKITAYSITDIAGDSYVWNVTNGTIVTGQNTNTVDVLWGIAGSGSISVAQTSPLGCDSTLSATIIILYTPAPVISGPDSACHNKIYAFSVPSVGGDAYTWTVTNGSIVTGQGTSSITVAFDTVGNGTVSIAQTSPLGCDSVIMDTIKILYTPAPTISGPDTTCHNKIQTYTVPFVSTDSYNWAVTNGAIVSGQGTNTVDVLWGTAGVTGSILATQTSPSGCDSMVGYNVVVILYTPAPVITGTDSACHNKPYNYSVPSVAGDVYTWNITNGTILSGQNTNAILVLWDTAGTGTLSITQTSPLGCDSTVTQTIDVLYTPVPVILGSDTVCHNKIYTYSVPDISGDSYNWSVSNGSIISGQGTNSVDVLWGTAGSGSITITQTSALGCDSTITGGITILYTPAPVISGPDSTCHNNIYTYSTPDIPGDTYNWAVSNGTIISGQGTNMVDVLWGTAGAVSISITQTSPLSCDSTITLPVQILYTPAPVISGPDTACQNKIYTFSVLNVGTDSYNWSVTNGTIIAGHGTNSIDVMLDTVGTNVVMVTQTSALGCDSTITDTVNVIYTPAPVLSGDDTVCHNKITTYSVTDIAGDVYTWNVTNGTIISGQSTNTVDVLWGTAGNGSISVTQTSPLGCDSTLSAAITILYTPAPVISGPDTACQNKIYTYSIPIVAGDAYSWTVTNGTIISGQGTNSIDVMLDTVGTTVVSITQTSPLGCDSTLTDTVDVIYTPAPVLAGDDTVCHNKITTYSVTNITGDSYTWNVNNGTIVWGQNTNMVDVLWGTAGSGSISVTQTSPLGCDSTLSAAITILYTPAPVLTGDDTVCHNKITTYSVTNIVGDSYVWNVTNGTIISGQSTNTVDILWGTAGSGSISVTQTSPLGCDSTLSAAITILYTPAPVISGPDSACQNKIYTYSIPSVAGDSYVWAVTNGTIIAGQGTNSIDVMLDTIGSSVVSVIQTSSLGCDSTLTDTIAVIYTPVPVLAGDDTVCHNKITTYSVTDIAGDSYVWNVTNGTIVSGQNTNTVDVLWGIAGSGSISVTQTSPLGCDSTLSAAITILYTPSPIISGLDSACQNKIYSYSVPNIGTDSYNWVITNGTIIAGQGTHSIDVMLDTVGTSVVSVIQTSLLGCDSTITDTVDVIYTPAPVLAGDDTVCHNKITTYSVTNIAGDSYVWNVTNGTIISGQSTNTVDILWGTAGSGSISVTQTSPLGCDSTLSAAITILYTPAPVISGTDSACQNKIYTYSIPNVAGDAYSWAVTNGTIIAGQGTNSINVMLDTIGTSVVRVTQTSPLGCDSNITDTIKVIYTPVPVITGPDTTCHNKIQSYSVPFVPTDGYVWNVTNGTIVSGQNTNSIDVLWGTAGNGSLSVTQTSTSGCDSTVSYNVVVILYTPAPVIAGNGNACHNKPYNYSVTAVSGDSYTWTITNGAIVSGQGTDMVTVLWDTVGTGTITITETSPLGCDSTISRAIDVIYTPAPLISGPDTSCHNDIKTYSVPNVPGDSYSWSVNNGTIISGQGTNTVDVLWGTAGITGNIFATQTSPLGCDSTVGYNVVVILYTPAPVITGNDSVCDNNIYSYSTPAVAGDTYTWTVTGGTILSGQNTNSINVVWNGVGTGNVTIYQASPLGCDSTLVLPVWILYTPSPVIAGPDTACQNKIYTYSVPNVGSDSYNWSITNGTIIAGQGTYSIDVMLDTLGTSVVSITQTSALGCDSTNTDTITVIYTPAPILSGDDTVCHNKITTYSVTNITGDSYTWNVTNGSIVAGQSTNTIDVLWGIAGNGTVSVTQTSPLGCDSTLSAYINILYTPAPVIAGPDSACQNKIYTYSIPSVAGDAYVWAVTNGTIIAGQGTNSIDVMLDTVGTSVVSITQTSPMGCDSILADTIDVIYTPAPVLTGDDTVCHNKITTYSVTDIAGDSYTWNVTNGTIVSGQSTNTVDVLWGTAGSGSISVTQTSPLGCDSTLSVAITILYTPAPLILGFDSACQNKIYTYSIPNVAGDAYVWAVTNGTIIAGQGTNSIDVMLDTMGTSVVSVTQTSALGCDSTITDTIDVIYTPAPVLTGADTVCHNKISTYSVTNFVGDSYVWGVTNGTIIAGQNTNRVDVLWGTAGSGSISVTQTSQFGCDSTLSATITILYTPAPVISGTDSACHNNIYTYSVPFIVNDTFNWSVSNGTIIAGQGTNSVDVLWGTVGAASISVTQTSPLSCDSTITLPVQILYTPAPVITGPDSACQNKIYSYSVPNVAGDAYSWAVTNGTIIAGQGTTSIDVMLDSVGTGIVSITQTSALGCDSTITDTIDVIYTPAPVLTGDDTVCHNNIHTYSVTDVTGDSYLWNVTNGTILSGQSTNTVDVLWGTAGNGSISVTQTSALGCDSTLSAAITILYTPAPVLTGPDSVCHNKIYTFRVPNVSGDLYTWTVTNGFIITGQGTNSITAAFDTVGNGTVSIVQASQLGCDSTLTDTIKVIYTPAPSITGLDTSCHNKILTYTAPFVPSDNYVWNVTNGTLVSGQGTNSVDVLWGLAGTGGISLIQSSPSGCDSTVAINVVVILYTPAPVISGNDSSCGDKVYVYSVPAVSGDTYSWSITNGTIVSGQNANIVHVIWDTVGTGVLTINQASSLGCDSTMSDTIRILTTPNPLVVGADTVCFNKIHAYSVTPVAGNTYNWSVTNGVIISGQNTSGISVLWGTPGTGTVRVTQTTSLGCDSTVTDTITIQSTPTPVITGADTVCYNKLHAYSVSNIAGNTYAWTVTGGTIVAGQGTNNISVLWGSPGLGNVGVLQTSALGCDSSINLPVVIRYTPTPVISGPDSVCHNKIYAYTVPFVFGDSYNWSVSNGTIVSGQGTNNIDVMWGTPGTGVVSLVETSALGCDTIVYDTAAILYSPDPQIQGNSIVCFNQVHSYHVDSIGLDTYLWQVSGGTIVSGQGTSAITVQWTFTGGGFVRVTQTSPQGCDSIITLPVIIRYRPTPQVSGTTLVCSNKIITYSTPAVMGDTYNWTATNGTIIAGQGTNTVDVIWNLTDTGYIYVTQTSPLGCDSTVHDTITIRPSPAPVITGNDTVCHNKVGYYSVDSLPSHTYLWTITNGTLVSGQATSQAVVLWGPGGTGVVRIEQFSDLGCDSIMTLDVLIQPSPAPVIISPDTVCHNKIYQHSVASVSGHTYKWQVTNGTIVSDSVNNTVSVMWHTPGNGYIQIIQTSPLGCDSLMRDSVVIVGSPNPAINGPDSVCHNKITAYTITPAPLSDNYQWVVANGTILSGQGTPTITVQWGPTGSPSSVRVTQTNPYGCDSMKVKSIHVDPTPAPVIQGNTNICSENFEFYNITPQPGHTYSWAVTGGSLLSRSDSVGALVNWGAPGLGSVRIVQTNQYGCDSSYTLPVTIRQGPVRLINGPDTVCVDNQYNYITANSQAGDVYIWSVVGGTIQGPNNTSQVSVLWNTVGFGSVTLDITNSFGCDSTFTIDIVVFELPIPDLRGEDKACNNTKNNLFKDYKYNSTQSTRYTYSWSLSGGGVITTPPNVDSILVDWLSVGTHTVSLTITDQISGCVATNTFDVLVDSLHVPVINTSGVSGCSPLHVTFTEIQNNSDLSYQWQIDGLGYTTNKEPDYTYYLPGTYNVRVIVTNAVGCVDTAFTQVIVRPSPNADFVASKGGVYTYEQDTAYFTNTSTGAVKYLWTYHDLAVDSNFNTSKYYDWPGEYLVNLRVENEYGCSDSVEKLVKVVVKPILFVPNAITSNGDFNNDYFEVSSYFVTEMKIIIFDRWGEIIFTSEDVNFKWDGTYKGYPVQQDVYGYYIVARGFNHELMVRSGNITVLR